MGWTAWIGWVFGGISTIIALANRGDANKYRRLDRPWVEQAGGMIEASHRSIQVRIANDDKGSWELIAARIISPGPARLAVTRSYDDDGYGGAVPKPGDWKQNITFDRWNGTLHVNVVKEPVKILFTLRSRADPLQTLDSSLTVHPPQSP